MQKHRKILPIELWLNPTHRFVRETLLARYYERIQYNVVNPTKIIEEYPKYYIRRKIIYMLHLPSILSNKILSNMRYFWNQIYWFVRLYPHRKFAPKNKYTILYWKIKDAIRERSYWEEVEYNRHIEWANCIESQYKKLWKENYKNGKFIYSYSDIDSSIRNIISNITLEDIWEQIKKDNPPR